MLVSSLREAVYSTKPPKGLRLLEKYETTDTSPTIRSQLKRLVSTSESRDNRPPLYRQTQE